MREAAGNRREGRETAMEGRAGGWRGRTRARRPGGHAARAAGLAAAEVIPGSSARWCGRVLSRQRSALLVAATSALCRATMHGAAQAFGRVRAIGAAKSVS